jgi:hypothetical protein
MDFLWGVVAGFATAIVVAIAFAYVVLAPDEREA